MKNFTKSTLAALVGASAISSTAQADDGFRFYGWLNPMYLSVDDGEASYGNAGDNTNAPSRIGFWYENALGAGTLKFHFETALGFNGSVMFGQDKDVDVWEWDQTDLRHVQAIYETNGFGTFSVGQGSTASDMVAAGTDMSGTTLVSKAAVHLNAGGFNFKDSTGGNGPAVKAVFKNFDGPRAGRVRYDSEKFGGGFVVSASAGTEILKEGDDTNFYDVALRYTTETDQMKVRAYTSFMRTEPTSGDSYDSILGAVGVLHKDSGLSGTVTIGNQSNSGDYIFAKVGWQQSWFSFGKTYLSVDAFKSQDMVSDGDDGLAIGLAAVQKIDDANMEVYVGYHTHSYDDTTGKVYNDLDAYMFGARWKF
ncbi:hypothetical protein BXY66_0298 [Shimia isoporae]|uniref:Porin n=1 Tax=Shimia isoporae TaxID=647720 RepID=A0A4R1NNU5_9RHOB|nr:porin [Shimia isoporae]TCL08263.1 hypothetical protein BXY66_0298 [Shimia isoporae]